METIRRIFFAGALTEGGAALRSLLVLLVAIAIPEGAYSDTLSRRQWHRRITLFLPGAPSVADLCLEAVLVAETNPTKQCGN